MFMASFQLISISATSSLNVMRQVLVGHSLLSVAIFRDPLHSNDIDTRLGHVDYPCLFSSSRLHWSLMPNTQYEYARLVMKC